MAPPPPFRQIAEDLFQQAENAAGDGRILHAADRFGRAAAAFRLRREPVLAGAALLELAACLLELHRAPCLPHLAQRLRQLAPEPSARPGEQVTLFVFASFVEQARNDPRGLQALLAEHRRRRHPAAWQTSPEGRLTYRLDPFDGRPRRKAACVRAIADALDCPVRTDVDGPHVDIDVPASLEGLTFVAVFDTWNALLEHGALDDDEGTWQ